MIEMGFVASYNHCSYELDKAKARSIVNIRVGSNGQLMCAPITAKRAGANGIK